MKLEPELDKLVDEFALNMKQRLFQKQKAGWHGWQYVHSEDYGKRLLWNAAKAVVKHKFVDIADTAILAMLIWFKTR